MVQGGSLSGITVRVSPPRPGGGGAGGGGVGNLVFVGAGTVENEVPAISIVGSGGINGRYRDCPANINVSNRQLAACICTTLVPVL